MVLLTYRLILWTQILEPSLTQLIIFGEPGVFVVCLMEKHAVSIMQHCIASCIMGVCVGTCVRACNSEEEEHSDNEAVSG